MRAQRVVLVDLLLEFLFIIVLTVVFFTFVLGTLLPAPLIEAVGKHERKLHYLLVVRLAYHLAAVSEVENENFICCQHVTLSF